MPKMKHTHTLRNHGGVANGRTAMVAAPLAAEDTRHDELVAALPFYRQWLYREALNLMVIRHLSPHLVDDIVQEGYIAMWRALGRFDPSLGALPSYLTSCARHRMQEVTITERWTRGRDAAKREQAEGFTQDRGDETRRRIQAVIDQHTKDLGKPPTGAFIAAHLGMSQAAVSYQRKKMPTVAAAKAVSVGSAGAHTTSLDALTDEVGFQVEHVGASDDFDAIDLAYHDGEVAAALDRLTPQQRRYVTLRFWHQATPTELHKAFGYDPKGLWPAVKTTLENDLSHLRDLVAA